MNDHRQSVIASLKMSFEYGVYGARYTPSTIKCAYIKITKRQIQITHKVRIVRGINASIAMQNNIATGYTEIETDQSTAETETDCVALIE